MSDLETVLRTVLDEDASRVPPGGPMPDHVRPRVLRRRTMTVATAALTALALIAGSVLAIRSFDRSAVMPASPVPASSIPKDWMMEDGRDPSQIFTTRELEDPRDTSVPGVDITLLRRNGSWDLELAGSPPMDRTTAEVYSYGLVLDTTEDGVPDYLIGIKDDPTPPGDVRGLPANAPSPPHIFKVWVTDLATGETDKQIGPPYGFPIEFGHPDEEDFGPLMWFTFLGGSAPDDIDRSVRFFAWASLTIDGQIVARDIAPDKGWMTVGTARP
jgi:hypothetical protein